MANFLIHIDTENVEAEQIANQILKLYDVKSVEIIDDLRRIKKVFYVYAKDKEDFENLSFSPDKIVEIPDNFV
jgi:anthranilate/para-aminobenzoate synthase component I